MIEIPFLGDDFPDDIITDSHIRIPGLDPIPLDPEQYMWEWIPKQLLHREKVARDCARSSHTRKLHDALCKQPFGFGTVYFDITFNWIFEPREDDDSAEVPMLLYPAQVILLLLLDYVDRQPKGPTGSLAVPKARGVGATWIVSSDELNRWLHRKMYQGRFVSRNEDLVDNAGDSDSYFWKLDYQVNRLPSWMVPRGYTTQRGTSNRTHMKMVNPENGATLKGEATTTAIGVGGRARRYIVDEADRIRNYASVWGQLHETTDHVVSVSTYNAEHGLQFWNQCHGLAGWTKPVVYEMPWDCVPGRDEDWLERTRRSMRNDVFQREVMMNPHEGISTWVYPLARTKFPVPRTNWSPGLGLGFTGLDDGYDDDFAIGFFQWDRGGRKLIALDSYSDSHKTIRFYGNLLRGIVNPQYGAPTAEAMRISQWITRYQLWNNVHIGDRHGDNTSLTDGKSAWQIVQEEFGIYVQPSSAIHNDDKSRQDALGEMLTMMDFGDSYGAMAMLEAIQNNKKPPLKEDSLFAAEHRKPIHDGTSHLTTMAQYVAIYVLEHYVGRIYGGFEAKPNPGSVSNGWLTGKPTNADPMGRQYTRKLREERETPWIR
jgi:hypothetical protein